YFFDTWDYYKEEKENELKEEIKYNKDKKEKLNILFQYTKKYKVRKTSDIAKDLNMSERSIERYMKDLNNLYHNIGYDY
ncbi:hypothetical protein ACP3W2_27260, partial [Salmonella enterica]|uniref:hypothetical protein n=1 Tax=Salmonella enterica TaxID=28901 RepID=UPI003CEA93CB